MGGNMILSDAIERLSIENVKTGETFAAITHESVDTTSDDIVVRLRLSANSDSPYKSQSFTNSLIRSQVLSIVQKLAIHSCTFYNFHSVNRV